MNVNQALATSIALIERLREEQGARIQQLQETVSSIEAKEPIVVEREKVVPLPTTLVYESQLHELAAELTNYVNLESRHLSSLVENLRTSSDLKSSATNELLEARARALTESVDAAVALTRKELSESSESLSENISTTNDKLSSTRDEFIERIQSNQSSNVKLYNKVAKNLVDLSVKLTGEISDLQDQVYTALKDTEHGIRTDLASSTKKLSGELKKTKEQFDELVDGINIRIDESLQNTVLVEEKLDKVAKKLFEKIDSSDEKTTTELEALVADLGSVESSIENITEKLNKISTKKPKDGKDGRDGVDGKDGKDGRDGVDGKDAYQWQFKPHPSLKGFLMFKREDEADWKKIDLRVHQPQQNSNFMAGGPLIAPPQESGFGKITISEDGVVRDEEASSINFTGNLVNVTSDGSGNVEVAINLDPTGNPFTVFTKQLSGISDTITEQDHGLTNFYSYRVYNSLTNRDVSIVVETNGLTFNVYSLLDMTNLTFEVRGY